MFVSALFFILTMINIIAIKAVYWPLLRDHADSFMALHSLTKSWQFTIICSLFFLKTFIKNQIKNKIENIKQWCHETVIPIGNDRFLLNHSVKGEKIKLIIKRRENTVTAVVDEEFDTCYNDEALPFLLFEVEEFIPETIGCNTALVIFTENGEQTKIDLKSK